MAWGSLEVAADDRANRLGIDALAELGRALQVGEQDRGDLANLTKSFAQLRTIKGYVSDCDHASEATVRDLIHEAHERGLLTRSPKGATGGELTSKAIRMLKRESSRHRSA